MGNCVTRPRRRKVRLADGYSNPISDRQAYRLQAYRLQAYRLQAYRLQAYRLQAYRLQAYRLQAYRLQAASRNDCLVSPSKQTVQSDCEPSHAESAVCFAITAKCSNVRSAGRDSDAMGGYVSIDGGSLPRG